MAAVSFLKKVHIVISLKKELQGRHLKICVNLHFPLCEFKVLLYDRYSPTYLDFTAFLVFYCGKQVIGHELDGQ